MGERIKHTYLAQEKPWSLRGGGDFCAAQVKPYSDPWAIESKARSQGVTGETCALQVLFDLVGAVLEQSTTKLNRTSKSTSLKDLSRKGRVKKKKKKKNRDP